MSVYSKDANRTFATEREAANANFKFCDVCKDWIEDHDSFYKHNSSSGNANYHGGGGVVFRTGSNKAFTIGVEIEKIDEFNCRSIDHATMRRMYGWKKEDDGSLRNDDGISAARWGHELVSPAYSLFDDDRIEKEFNVPFIRQMINGHGSGSCGGHINLGSEIYSADQLFEGLRGFFPLLYILYEARISMQWSAAKKIGKYYCSTSHDQAFIIKDFGVEFRIFSHVNDLKTLLWRFDLIKIMCKNINASEKDVLAMMADSNSLLYKHIIKVINPTTMKVKLQAFIKYTAQYNSIKWLQPPIEIS